ncbi:hypothetical protein KSU1_C0262 [Candidatus Jettenia caeni]|uniref:Uncharacterized protein n=1 Tax=Candidatus Jettenia caeni TaxID=247490 RepID=I3IJG3_9BACT|nr:hypothetical protein KSU1_C0262 [Candidatus Jettenia caeni]
MGMATLNRLSENVIKNFKDTIYCSYHIYKHNISYANFKNLNSRTTCKELPYRSILLSCLSQMIFDTTGSSVND